MSLAEIVVRKWDASRRALSYHLESNLLNPLRSGPSLGQRVSGDDND